MKTPEQILEGVTAGGQWYAVGGDLVLGEEHELIAQFDGQDGTADTDAAYAARAARSWPGLVRALEGIEQWTESQRNRDHMAASETAFVLGNIYLTAKTALAEALKD